MQIELSQPLPIETTLVDLQIPPHILEESRSPESERDIPRISHQECDRRRQKPYRIRVGTR